MNEELYRAYEILGRPPTMDKEAGVGDWIARQAVKAGRGLKEWGASKGRGLSYFGKHHLSLVDPRKYQAAGMAKPRHFGRAYETIRTGWRSMSPADLLKDYKRLGGTPQALRKLEKTNPGLADRIRGAVSTVDPGHTYRAARKLTPEQWRSLMKTDPALARRFGRAVRSARSEYAGLLKGTARKGGRVSAEEAQRLARIQGKKGFHGLPSFKPKAGKKHLLEKSRTLGEAAGGAKGLGKAKAVSEELSRRGWTGEGRVTKYLPVGGKGLTAGFAGMGATDVISPEAGTTRGEAAGSELGSNLAFIAGAPFGLVPMMASSTLAGYLGGKAGKGVSKVVGERPATKAEGDTTSLGRGAVHYAPSRQMTPIHGPAPGLALKRRAQQAVAQRVEQIPGRVRQLTPVQRQLLRRAAQTGAMQVSQA